MLQQMSEATLTLLLTMLAVGAVIRFYARRWAWSPW